MAMIASKNIFLDDAPIDKLCYLFLVGDGRCKSKLEIEGEKPIMVWAYESFTYTRKKRRVKGKWVYEHEYQFVMRCYRKRQKR
jgi:hypothetical protein